MTATGHFDWRTLGKADYAQASALVSSLPEGVRKKFKNDSREVCTWIVFLGWKQAEKSGKGAAYCYPTEGWLARKIGKSDRTIRRCLVLLRDAGIIQWRHRQGKFSAWTSNLYSLGKSFLATLFARSSKKGQRIQARTYLSDNDLKREYKANAPMQRGERLTDFLGLPRQQPNQPLGGASLELATDGWED